MSISSSFHAATDVLIPVGRVENEWPPQGKWTYEDYCRLPEDGWIYEIIEGELFMSPAPKTIHQKSSGRLFTAFLSFAQLHDLGEPYYSPIDVILPGLANPVQPDLIFIVKERLNIIKEERVEGAPDIIVEILSPWNWFTDRHDKFKIYAQAGVREYWLIDPKARTIEIFCLRGGTYTLIGKYGVGETVRSEVLPGFAVKVENVCPV